MVAIILVSMHIVLEIMYGFKNLCVQLNYPHCLCFLCHSRAGLLFFLKPELDSNFVYIKKHIRFML